MKLPFYVGVGLIIAGLTDFLDGFLSRRFGQVTEFGAKLDSFADNLLLISTVFWILMLKPEIFVNHSIPIIIWMTIGGLSLLVGWVKFKRFGNLHLYSSKAAAVTAYVFIVHALMSDYNPVLFYAAIALLIVSETEMLVLELISPKVDEHMKSIVFSLRRRNIL
jgi:phosphatidylglycerophosphate synthase